MKYTNIASLLFAASAMMACNTTTPEPSELYLIIGSYSTAEDEGIKVYTFDEADAETAYVSGLKGIENPSFVYPSADGTRVYAVGENFEEAKGTANALAFDAAKGTLTLLNTQPTYGDAPCNIIVNPGGRYVYTSNYNGGSITEFALDDEGRLGEGRLISFDGSSVDSLRQTQPHLHAVNFTPDGRFLLANDLGTDKIHVFFAEAPIDTMVYRCIDVPAGMGPRHLCFAPVHEAEGEQEQYEPWYAYLLGEISGDVVPLCYESFEYAESCFDLDEEKAVCADSLGAEGSADIHISPDGRYLYTSHRLKGDGVSIFRIDESSGTLSKIGYQPTGNHPRNFTISPDGRWLLVACRDDNVVQIYARDVKTGLLTDTGKKIEMSKPVCLQWIERP